jgi:hypothetical protein
VRERHPVPAPPPHLTTDERLLLLENRLAQLWDEVWWHQLPWWRRWWYRAQGFHSPITRFYVPRTDTSRDLDLRL